MTPLTIAPILLAIGKLHLLGSKKNSITGWMTAFKFPRSGAGTQSPMVFTLLDLGWALFWGLLNNAVSIYFGTLDVLDGEEFRDFLRRYGAEMSSLESPLIDSLYDAAFASLGGTGERKDDRLAAGVATRCFLHILMSYKGAPVWKMNAGMAETVFAPAYEVLKARGVKFKFFHRLRDISLSSDKKSVSGIYLGLQARTVDPHSRQPREYDPLEPLPAYGKPQGVGLMTWPNRPRAGWLDAAHSNVDPELFEDPDDSSLADVRRVDLHVNIFDRVVLAVPIGVIPSVFPELLKVSDRARAMVREVKTVRTLRIPNLVYEGS